MKLLHTADWHIGRTLNGFSLLDEQKAAFKQIIQIAKDEDVDGIVIAGDIYDRAVPSTNAVTALDEMLQTINIENKLPIYAISGNHDGSKRLNYGRTWMELSNFHLNTLLEEAFTPIETPEAQIFMLPFFDPMDARVYYGNDDIHTIGDAMDLVLADMYKLFDANKKHILITHFAVTPSADEEIELTSETSSKVGGLATLTASQFDKFDYVMLGHIHTHNASPAENIKYSGSPVKFNVKEARMQHKNKGVYIVDITENSITSKFHEITPVTDLIVLEENWKTLLDPAFYKTQPTDKAWFAITIKEFKPSEHIHANVRAELQQIYGTVVELDYQRVKSEEDNESTRQNIGEMSHEDVVGQFYQSITGDPLSKDQKELVDNIFVELQKGE
ncbi:exonuclease SbcCD subunit D [Companilactobacillus mishanensis]|uniref:Nuclease SbcCD subunit D n=1 Tax=Companilactobacillus mishanensis TaxID=2486008 RepID=A0ABW9P5R9_9LACO|nr:exonuclease SbcCD subunit D [Companilactobacillus mishanensis]MQS44576.1 exonuclease SbcCD subunit D [Companilactobacillus mishanensis]